MDLNDMINPPLTIKPGHAFLSFEVPPANALASVEKQLILTTLQSLNGNRTRAAHVLGISVRTLRNKLNQYKKEAGIE